MTPEDRVRHKLMNDFPYYASKALKISTKAGAIEPFELNKAQRYIHDQIEDQLKRTGKVRKIIVKGRQQGSSTYVGGRFYWKVTHSMGKKVFILTHEAEATKALFDMVDRYHENLPEALKPSTTAQNARELFFDQLQSGYRVGTAGAKGTGRGQTVHLFHGSEVAWWPHADEHAAGVLQAVPDLPGTEVILESTANGIGNYFHRKYKEALGSTDDYEVIFVPWFWQDEYATPPPADFTLDDEEATLAETYHLSNAQLFWRRKKIAELGNEEKFKQEYPNNAEEAFTTTSTDSFIPSELVVQARNTQGLEPIGPRLMGVDPARFGDDRTSIVFRQGRVVLPIASYEKLDLMEVVGKTVIAIRNYNPIACFVDVCGLGAGVYDRLVELGFGDICVPVNSAEKPVNIDKYANKRVEMWGEMKEWLREKPVSLPDSDSLQSDLCGVQYSHDSKGRLKLEKKEELKKRGLRSPDEADALALTFAPYHPDLDYNYEEDYVDHDSRNTVSGY